jgi:hypothetical protein
MAWLRAHARSIRRGLTLAAVVVATAGGGSARGQAPEGDAGGDDLATARRLFTEAMADEGAKRFDTALDKYRKVGTFKDTANVRYRIATCLEALGRRAEALSSYASAAKLSEGDRTQADVYKAAADHASQLDRIVPRLTVVLPANAPPDTQVRVDDAPVDAAALREAIPLDPGTHTIAATASGDRPFRTAVTLGEGGRVSITVDLAPIAAPAASLSASAGPAGSATAPVGTDQRPSHGAPAGAWVALGLGGALAAGSAVTLVLRALDWNKINSCPASTTKSNTLVCPDQSYSNARDRIVWEGPLGVGLGAGAVVSLGIGVWLLATAPSSSVRVAPVVSDRGAMLVVGGTLDQ